MVDNLKKLEKKLLNLLSSKLINLRKPYWYSLCLCFNSYGHNTSHPLEASSKELKWGSFKKIGGHNPLEISNYNCVLFFGPEMFNFKQIKEIILKKKAGFEVSNHEDLANKITITFNNKRLKKQTIDNFKNLCKEEALKVKKVLKNFSI